MPKIAKFPELGFQWDYKSLFTIFIDAGADKIVLILNKQFSESCLVFASSVAVSLLHPTISHV